MTPFLRCFICFVAMKFVLGNHEFIQYLQPDNADDYDTLSPFDNNNVSCVRECVVGAPPRICYYHFLLEIYTVLNPACGKCPDVVADCYQTQCVTANGHERGILTANRRLPGPGIQACLGDRIIVDVMNTMPGRETALHWHGVHLMDQPYMDGVPMITQCSIHEAETYRYDFFANNAGSFFWHSHDGFQKMDGLAGNLVIREPKQNDPNSHLYDYDLPNHVMLIMDWYDLDADQHFPGLLTHDKSQDANSYLINGRGRHNTDERSKRMPLAVYRVTQGKSYRLRLIGALCSECPVRVKIESHEMLVLATDGNPVKPTLVSSVVLEAGMRFDIVLNASKSVASYWIRIQGLAQCSWRNVQQLAVLQYEGSNHQEPLHPPEKLAYLPQSKELNSENATCGEGAHGICMHQLTGTATVPQDIVKSKADLHILLKYDMHYFSTEELYKSKTYYRYQQPGLGVRRLGGEMNNISSVFPSAPLLSQFEDISPEEFCPVRSDGTPYCDKLNCHCVHMRYVPLGAVVQIVLVDQSQHGSLNHPFHLHGNYFVVLEMGTFDKGIPIDKILEEFNSRNFSELPAPPFMDTLGVPSQGYSIIRFKADNPGYWVFHCHILNHQETGMFTIFQVGNRTQIPPVPDGFHRCGNYIPSSNQVKSSGNDTITVSYLYVVLFLSYLVQICK